MCQFSVLCFYKATVTSIDNIYLIRYILSMSIATLQQSYCLNKYLSLSDAVAITTIPFIIDRIFFVSEEYTIYAFIYIRSYSPSV